jgi:hypothetical protein
MYLGIHMLHYRTTCEEAPEEDKTVSVDSFNKLSCHISISKLWSG